MQTSTRQRELPFENGEALRQELVRKAITGISFELLLYAFARGTKANGCSTLVSSTRALAAAILHDKSKHRSVHDAARRLAEKGLLSISPGRRGTAYVVWWQNVWEYEPPAAFDLPARPPLQRCSVGVQSTSPVSITTHKSRLPSEYRNREAPQTNDPTKHRLNTPDPWGRQGFQDGDLRRAVQESDRNALRLLYTTAAASGWIQHSYDSAHRFLAVAHHAATAAGVRSPMGLLRSRTSAGLPTHYLTDASWIWAKTLIDSAQPAYPELVTALADQLRPPAARAPEFNPKRH